MTYIWVGSIDTAIAERIRRDFPRWTPEAGACERCIESYSPPRLI
ncbi:MAG TPA: hypothetical protein VNL14_20275 [Candidatus Acidoferrales bacterium]|nr:hypothetical protein [Candidatus Acidoferrales bacterium]